MDIIVENINKKYPGNPVPALADLTFSVAKGTLFGLVGPDGAGKTTLFRILATLMLADSGRAVVLGKDAVRDFREIRQHIGYMPGKFSLYQDLTIEENLKFFATVFGTTVQKNYDLIKDIYIQLEPFKNRRAGQLSGGMKQKLALCCALIHRPGILFLDEPTTGVDTVSRKEFWNMLRNLRETGLTILVSTPYMDEALLCEEIALLQSGNLLSVNTPGQIIADFKGVVYSVRADNMIELLKNLREMKFIQNVYAFGEYHHVIFENALTKDEESGWIQNLQSLGHDDVEVKFSKPEIEDCFIQLMQN